MRWPPISPDALALKAIKLVFEYLPRAYEHGASDPDAREHMANASTIAGMAFANAFLGVCHSMAHKLGAFPPPAPRHRERADDRRGHRFNAAEVPVKMGTFSQYGHPHTLRRYAQIAESLNLPGETDEAQAERAA